MPQNELFGRIIHYMSIVGVELGSNIEGFDLDDTLFMREGITRFAGFLKGRLKPYSLPKYTLNTLPDLDHTPIDYPISGRKEQLAFDYHRKRVAIPGVVDKLKAKVDQGKKLVALSGRAATLAWYEMTLEQLAREGLPITEVILTPDGVSTSVSKAHGMLIAGVYEFNDDDLKTQLFLSGFYPGRQFNWIRHGLTNIPAKKEILATRHNLRVVSLAEWMQS